MAAIARLRPYTILSFQLDDDGQSVSAAGTRS